MMSVAESTSIILVNYGIQGLSFSRVARSAKVSRAWLYKYIGKTKEDLIAFSVDVFGRAFAQLENLPLVTDRQEWIDSRVKALTKMLGDSLDHPWISQLYFRYRGLPNALGKKIVEMEQRYLRKEVGDLVNSFKVPKARAQLVSEILTAFRMGLAYRWAHGGLSKIAKPDEVIEVAKFWLEMATAPVAGQREPVKKAPKGEKRVRIGSYALVHSQGSVLLVKKARGPYKGLWDLPGGGIEFGENPAEALHRELDEETGLNGVQAHLITVLSQRERYAPTPETAEDLHFMGLIYRVELPERTMIRQTQDPHEARWFPVAAAEANQLTPFAMQALHAVFPRR